MSTRINEHDITKRMIDTLRRINEGDEDSDVITPAKNDPVYQEEHKKISDTVDPRVNITKFKIFPKDRDVQFEGRFDTGINFFMSTRAMKLSISITDPEGKPIKIFVDADLISTIQKLNGFYENWTREWAQKLNSEYNNV
jgi:hypothetical protein